jgi:hypothetical protein
MPMLTENITRFTVFTKLTTKLTTVANRIGALARFGNSCFRPSRFAVHSFQPSDLEESAARSASTTAKAQFFNELAISRRPGTGPRLRMGKRIDSSFGSWRTACNRPSHSEGTEGAHALSRPP